MARTKSEKAVTERPTRARKSPAATRRTTRTPVRPAKSQASVAVMHCTEAQIRERAYYIYLERGDAAGDPVADWHQAERELNSMAAGAKA